jgi:hypothetical protein
VTALTVAGQLDGQRDPVSGTSRWRAFNARAEPSNSIANPASTAISAIEILKLPIRMLVKRERLPKAVKDVSYRNTGMIHIAN